MNEQWIWWKPLEELAKNYYIDAVLDTNNDGFIIQLSEVKNEKKKIKIVFENSVAAYRNTSESFRLYLLEELEKKYGSRFYTEWSFFTVVNSEYLKWLSIQSEGITQDVDFTHFVIFGSDSVLEIICGYEPRMEMME
jgi:hypothetical protein